MITPGLFQIIPRVCSHPSSRLLPISGLHDLLRLGSLLRIHAALLLEDVSQDLVAFVQDPWGVLGLTQELLRSTLLLDGTADWCCLQFKCFLHQLCLRSYLDIRISILFVVDEARWLFVDREAWILASSMLQVIVYMEIFSTLDQWIILLIESGGVAVDDLNGTLSLLYFIMLILLLR